MKKNKIYPIRLNTKSCKNTIDLFYYNNHFSFIKNFPRLVNSQVSKDTRLKYYCKKCLNIIHNHIYLKIIFNLVY